MVTAVEAIMGVAITAIVGIVAVSFFGRNKKSKEKGNDDEVSNKGE